jgi:hypothetical protein
LQIEYFFEDGAKHKGQLKWICERDGLPIPEFLQKKDRVPFQAADFIAWMHNLYLRNDGKIPLEYDKALLALSSNSDWGITRRLDDPDMMPTVLNIPLRDPNFTYQCKIFKTPNGRRHLYVTGPRTSQSLK